jgi:hypothetical protein
MSQNCGVGGSTVPVPLGVGATVPVPLEVGSKVPLEVTSKVPAGVGKAVCALALVNAPSAKMTDIFMMIPSRFKIDEQNTWQFTL